MTKTMTKTITLTATAVVALGLMVDSVNATDVYSGGGAHDRATQYQGGDVVTRVFRADDALLSTFGNLDLGGCNGSCQVHRQEQNGAVITDITVAFRSHITNAGNASAGAPYQDQFGLVLVKVDHLKGGSVLNAGNIAGLK